MFEILDIALSKR